MFRWFPRLRSRARSARLRSWPWFQRGWRIDSRTSSRWGSNRPSRRCCWTSRAGDVCCYTQTGRASSLRHNWCRREESTTYWVVAAGPSRRNQRQKRGNFNKNGLVALLSSSPSKCHFLALTIQCVNPRALNQRGGREGRPIKRTRSSRTYVFCDYRILHPHFVDSKVSLQLFVIRIT